MPLSTASHEGFHGGNMFPLMGALGLGAGLIDSFLGANSAREANRTNIRLQRSQQDWERMMSNTAIQRRKADIVAAGGNPALAFTTGSEASTPSVPPARVEPTYRGNPGIMSAVMTAQNLQAQTRLTNAQAARSEFDLRWLEGSDVNALKRDLLQIEKDIKSKEYDELIPAQIAKIAQDTKTSAAAEANSAAQADKIRRTIDEMEALLKQQVRAGKLDLDALENIAKIGGIEADKAKGIIGAFLNGIKFIILRGRGK